MLELLIYRREDGRMTTATPEYLQQVFDYEEQGYTAAESGDYGTAAQVWQAVLADQDMAACFDEDSRKEIAFNLAAAYLMSGDQSACDKTISDWSLGAEDRETIYASIESGAEG
jgi:hypothetical protein